MKHRNIILGVACLLVAVISCKKPYTPPVITNNNNYLVVEGVINSGSDSTIIKLSRTVKLSESVTTKPEKGAVVTVEGNGTAKIVPETTAGVYVFVGLNLDATKRYRLRIKSGGQEYLSDEADVKTTPPIDTVNYATNGNSLRINVSAHDPSGNTRYYRWDYEETWRFNAKYNSGYKVQNDTIVPRQPSEQVFSCFAGRRSSTISIASSVKLSNDVIANAPITDVTSTSEKISVRYSILVKQYALTKDAYGFWENLKKNTEELGSIFDALPSELLGNIHNTSNPAEPVLGYFSISTIQTKRIYIDKQQLPAEWRVQYPFDCQQDTALYFNPITKNNDVRDFILSKLAVPTFLIPSESPTKPKGYGYTSYSCADCTVRGVKAAPIFWRDK